MPLEPHQNNANDYVQYNSQNVIEQVQVLTANDATNTELHLRPIPQEIVYPAGIKQPNEIDGVVSWVTSIEALFERKEIVLSDGRMMRPGNYIIPPYQRKYTWSYDIVSQLCRDLLRSADEGKESYHLGTIILHHQPGEQGDSFYVVDGQQRLRRCPATAW